MSEMCPYCDEYSKPPQWIAEVAALRAERDALVALLDLPEHNMAQRIHHLQHSLKFLAEIARGFGFANRKQEPNEQLIGRALRESDFVFAYDALIELIRPSVRALDALPTEAPGEMVEVHGVVKNDDGVIYIIDDSLADGYAGHVIATITARVPLPRVPEIVATVETGK